MQNLKCTGKRLLLKELKHSYNFFMKEANTNINSAGYGLIRDKTNRAQDVASIASCGYGLAALVIGVKRNWISFNNAYFRANKTLDTFLNNLECYNGFYFHFVNMETAKREWNCEVSIIDTAIFICGALLAGEFFGNEIKVKSELLYERINWNWYLNSKTNQFYMSYSPEKGFSGKWDMYAEQLIIYILSVGSPTFPVNKDVYSNFQKPIGSYNNIKNIIYTYCGTLFTYQYSHAWIDFRNLFDENGINWFENSVKATLSNRQFCIDNSSKFKTFGENSWGLTACIGPNGYSGDYGALPCLTNLESLNDGTISPSGPAGSIVFTPKFSISALEYFYNNFPNLWGKYGFKDSFNLEGSTPWFADEYIGIDKGISMIMIENFLSSFIWDEFMKNCYIKNGLKILGFSSSNKRWLDKMTNNLW